MLVYLISTTILQLGRFSVHPYQYNSVVFSFSWSETLDYWPLWRLLIGLPMHKLPRAQRQLSREGVVHFETL